jgi:long-chain acyl-CoA synthetase
MFCYTSGTTGDAKGAKITHYGLVANTSFWDYSKVDWTNDDVVLSYLPLAHAYEQSTLIKSIAVGFQIGYYSGDVLKLMEDVVVLKPTVFNTVPRILNRIYSKILEGVATKSGFAQWLFNKAIKEKAEAYKISGSLAHSTYDATVLKTIRPILGGRVRAMTTGAAPINADVLAFLQVAFSAHIHEGYGQTEALITTLTDKNDINSAGTVGGPVPTIRFRLKDIPEMGYLHTDKPYPRGELQFYGNTLFKGYYKNPERTAEAFSEDGWINSGDVSVILPNGNIKIIDRAKNIFKLAQGEYVAPEKLENIYVQAGLVGQIFVYGDSLQSFLVGIVVPDPEVLPKFVQANPELAGLEKAALLESPVLKKAVLAQLEEKAKEYKLSGIERVRKVHITPHAFTVQNDTVTPTFKLKRFNAKRFFLEHIQEMYSEGI